ncbi:hypothetical protein A6J64_020595 [Yersinia enterocolitica]|nr:hypothetical protein A6J63_021620 [Yersinia enterocolitica]PNM14210.1 hypothetical protein A6J64_020595 [Yersinia enterocolitica]PNM19142.1 hypothetical protein A6J65_009825 [Yersinia enterocolitica]RLZ01081.1 hypothetical protein COO51_04990 [Yersinia enterocolitica]
MCVGCLRSPQSLTYVSSWGFTQLPPSCNSNHLGIGALFTHHLRINAADGIGSSAPCFVTSFGGCLAQLSFLHP